MYDFLVRLRVKEIIELLQDDERLRTQRKQARQVKTKYGGISSNDYGGKSFYSEIFNLILSEIIIMY